MLLLLPTMLFMVLYSKKSALVSCIRAIILNCKLIIFYKSCCSAKRNGIFPLWIRINQIGGEAVKKHKISRCKCVSLITLLYALTCCMWLESSTTQVVESPRKPKAPNAGRVIVPKEVMAISGEGPSDHHFKYAWSPRVAPNGSLLVRTISKSDGRTQILMFDKAGRFVRNLEGKGSEPMSYSGFFIAGKNVVVLAEGRGSVYLPKLLWFDSAGIYEREIPCDVHDLLPLAYIDGTFYFGTGKFHNALSDLDNEKPKIIDEPHDILTFTDGSGAMKSLACFPTREFAACEDLGGRIRCTGAPLSSFIALPYQAKYLILSHTSEYLLKIYAPATNAVIGEFRRVYKRVKNAQGKRKITIGGKTYTVPDQKYYGDIRNIFTRGDEIWAVTSTYDKTKGNLIDLFDGDGIYTRIHFILSFRSRR